MKFIKQKSTGQIVYREEPHSDKTLNNASTDKGIDVSDLEVVDENWTEKQWGEANFNQKSYSDKRKAEYDQMGNQFEMMFDDQRDGTTTWVDKINEIKSRYPKG